MSRDGTSGHTSIDQEHNVNMDNATSPSNIRDDVQMADYSMDSYNVPTQISAQVPVAEGDSTHGKECEATTEGKENNQHAIDAQVNNVCGDPSVKNENLDGSNPPKSTETVESSYVRGNVDSHVRPMLALRGINQFYSRDPDRTYSSVNTERTDEYPLPGWPVSRRMDSYDIDGFAEENPEAVLDESSLPYTERQDESHEVHEVAEQHCDALISKSPNILLVDQIGD